MKHPVLSVSILTFLLLLHMVFFTSCSDQVDETARQKTITPAEPTPGGIYRFPLPSNPATLDPAYIQDIYGRAIVHQIFDGLVRFDSSLTITPALAETWQIQEGGKSYRFTLKKEALFHNREPVTSEDVIFSLSRLLKADPPPAVLPHLMKIVGAREYRAGTRDSVAGLVTENENEFTVQLEAPHVPFLTALGMYQAAIVPKKEVLNKGKIFGTQPVGTGPFRFVSWEKDKSIRLDRHNNYFAGPAHLEEIHYKIYPGKQDLTMIKDFQERRLEEMAVYGDIKETLSKTKGLQWFHRPSLSLFFYGMNVKHPNLSDPDLRSALSASIDRLTFVKEVYRGQFDIAQTILPPGMPGYNPANRMPDFGPDNDANNISSVKENQEKAIEIVSAFQTPRVEQEMAMIKEFWSNVGISATVKYITDWKAFEDYIKSDKVQIYRYAWFADMPDPDSFLYSLFASESPTNYMKFSEKDVDQMLLAARGIIDPVERAAMYQKTEARILELTPLIPLFYMSVDRVYQPYVKSAKVNALGAHAMPLNKIWLDKSSRNKD